jgi:hypothetical protein
VLLSSFYLVYILLPTDVLSVADIRIVSRLSSLIVYSGYDFETVCHMNCIDNAVVGYYKNLSFLSYLTRNMDIFLLIFQLSEFLSIYTIVITRLLSCFRPRFQALSLVLSQFDIHLLCRFHKNAAGFMVKPCVGGYSTEQ